VREIGLAGARANTRERGMAGNPEKEDWEQSRARARIQDRERKEQKEGKEGQSEREGGRKRMRHGGRNRKTQRKR